MLKSKRPVLILHGGPGLGLEYFEPPLQFLKETHFVYAFEYLGQGLGEIMSSLSNQIRKAGVAGPIDVVAHSWGSFVLFKLIRERRLTNVGKVVFVTPVPTTMPGLLSVVERFEHMISSRLSPAAAARLQVLVSDGNGPQDREKICLLKPCYVANEKNVHGLRFDNYNSRVHAQVFGEMAGYDFRNELVGLAGRFSLISGEKDFIRSEELQDYSTHALISVQMPNVGHSPFIEQSKGFADLVQRMLR